MIPIIDLNHLQPIFASKEEITGECLGIGLYVGLLPLELKRKSNYIQRSGVL